MPRRSVGQLLIEPRTCGSSLLKPYACCASPALPRPETGRFSTERCRHRDLPAKGAILGCRSSRGHWVVSPPWDLATMRSSPQGCSLHPDAAADRAEAIAIKKSADNERRKHHHTPSNSDLSQAR